MSYAWIICMKSSFNRFDRLPYLLKRWKGPMSIGVFVMPEEYPAFVDFISHYMGLPITLCVYIPLGLENTSYYIRRNQFKQYFTKTLYPMNLLRDLAIESITTSHFMYVDADFMTSGGNSDSYSHRYRSKCNQGESRVVKRRECDPSIHHLSVYREGSSLPWV